MKTKLIYPIIIVICITSFLKCSKDDPKDYSSIHINPPTWIQGTWMESSGYGYEFTTNDIIELYPPERNSTRQKVEEAINRECEIEGQEESNDSIYHLYVDICKGSTWGVTSNVSFNFQKVSNNELMKFTWNGTFDTIHYTKQ